ncbi:MAG: GGDEF domain-containing protein [Roseateles sp.]
MSFADTLFVLMPLQAMAAALVLIVFIGWRGANAGGRWAQVALLVLSLGLVLLSPAFGGRLEAPLGTQLLGFALVSAGLTALWWALGLWFVPQPGRQAMLAAPLVIVALQALLGHNRLLALAVADALLAAQLAWLGVLLARPGRPSVLQGLNSRRWRLLGLMAVLPLLLALVWRTAVLGLSHGDTALPDLLLGLAGQLALLLTLPMVLLAWRSQTEAELARLSQTDGLTGLIDSAAFAQRSVDLISMARRYDEPLALVIVQLDDLPALRAEHGDDFADRALALFASCVHAQMRLGDLAGRLGDDCFGVLMARCLPEGPQALDRRLRAALAARAQMELGLQPSFSAGWAKLRPGDRGLADLQRRAETALYEATRAGSGLLMAEPGVSD